eukprot:84717-Hanusia_phi.AAC.2
MRPIKACGKLEILRVLPRKGVHRAHHLVQEVSGGKSANQLGAKATKLRTELVLWSRLYLDIRLQRIDMNTFPASSPCLLHLRVHHHSPSFSRPIPSTDFASFSRPLPLPNTP